MKSYWTQPSLSRDFALLAAAVLFMLFMATGWVTYRTYNAHAAQIAGDMELESQRIERVLAGEMESAGYLLTALGKQIVLEKDRDLIKLAQVLQSYDSKGSIYSIFSWINPDQRLMVSSNRGVLDSPIDVADRDYVKKAMAEPWKMHIGRPIEGRASGRWVIPVAVGLTDSTGRFIGIIMASIDINTLTERLSNLVRREGISFAIVSKTLIPLTQVSEDKDFVTNNFPTQKLGNVDFSTHPVGLISEGSLLWGAYNYSFYRVSTDYPYIILLGYDSHHSDITMREQIALRLTQMLFIAGFMLLLLWIINIRIIRPVLDMTQVTASIAKGEPYRALPRGGPVEIEGLASQVQRIGDYIQETKRIEDELRNKMFMLKKAKENAEIDRRAKSEFLAYLCQEMRGPLNNIIGFSQVMRDQVYGPIENRKYRQYAGDIYQTGNTLLSNLQDLLALSKIESENVELAPRLLDVQEIISKALRGMQENPFAAKVKIDTRLNEPLPQIVGDEFHSQQMLANLLIYVVLRTRPGAVVAIEARSVSETRDKPLLAIAIHTGRTQYSSAQLLEISERSAHSRMPPPSFDQIDIGLELGRALVALHQGYMDLSRNEAGEIAIVIFLSPPRIRFSDEA